jgi:hypothetical protein
MEERDVRHRISAEAIGIYVGFASTPFVYVQAFIDC